MFIGVIRQGVGPRILSLCLVLGLSLSSIASFPLIGLVLAQSDQPTEPEPSKTGSAPDALGKAKGYAESGQFDAAIGLLKNVIATASGPNELAQAYFLLAAAYVKKRQPAEAIPYLDQLLSEFPKSELAGRARLLLGTAQADLGNLDQALPALAEARSLSGELGVKLEALRLAGEIYARKKDFAHAIEAWREEIALAPAEQRDAVRGHIRSLVMQKMDKAALVRLHEATPKEFPGDLALMRLIELHFAAGDDHLAERTIRQFLERFPEHEYAQTATQQLASLKAKLKSSKHMLVAFLPLSGSRLSTFGTEALNGVRLALEHVKTGMPEGSIALLIKDSEGGKGGVRAELVDVLMEYRPIAVIGPLLSRDLMAVASLAGQMEVPFITPSASLTDLQRLGPYIFSTALTPPPQIHRLADYAIKQSGFRRFCMLHPETPFGQEFARLFSQEVRQHGGEIIAVESYKAGETDFGPAISRLKTADLKKFGKSTNTPTSKGGTRPVYTPGFDALFIPDAAEQVSLLASQLIFYDVRVALLGINAWNSPELLRVAGRSLEGGVFTDGFFSDSMDPDVREFVDRYRQRYHSEPSLFSAQAYDATRIVLEAIQRGGSSGAAVRDFLAKSQDLATLTGPASFNSRGTLDRQVLLIQVKQGKLVKVGN